MNLKIVSLGAGVQSSAMLLMGLDGRFGDRPDCAIFVDTQDEPNDQGEPEFNVMGWLDDLEGHVAPFPIHRLTAGDLMRDGLESGRGHIPAWTTGADGKEAPLSRVCTIDYKIKVQQKFAIDHGATEQNPVEQWLGISLDECHRMKPSRDARITLRYPLIDQRLTRNDCRDYLIERMGRCAPKSACVCCPWHEDDYWIRLKSLSPKLFERACDYDEAQRFARYGVTGGATFLHRSLKPLRTVDLIHEKQGRMFGDVFGNECDGVCGT